MGRDGRLMKRCILPRESAQLCEFTNRSDSGHIQGAPGRNSMRPPPNSVARCRACVLVDGFWLSQS